VALLGFYAPPRPPGDGADDRAVIATFPNRPAGTPYPTTDPDHLKKNALVRAELQVGRQFALYRCYRSLEDVAQPGALELWAIDGGRVVLLSLKSRRFDTSVIPYGDVAAGLWDATIDALADGLIAANRRKRIWLCYNHEPSLEEAYQTTKQGTQGAGTTLLNVAPIPIAVTAGESFAFQTSHVVVAVVAPGAPIGATQIPCSAISGTVTNGDVLPLQTQSESNLDFAAAWRRIHTRMNARPGFADLEVKWLPIFLPNTTAQLNEKWPGDAYADYVGLDGPYELAPQGKSLATSTFGTQSIPWALTKNKPIVVGEWSLNDQAGFPNAAADYILGALAYLKTLPIKGDAYWSGGPSGFWLAEPPEGSSLKLEAFRTLAFDEFFAELPEPLTLATATPQPSPIIAGPAPPEGGLYRLEIARRSDDRLLDEIPIKALTYSEVLNDAGVCTFELSKSDPKCKRETLEPGQRVIRVYREDALVWAGPLWAANTGLRESVVRFAGAGFFSALDRRLVTADQIFTDEEQLEIAWALIAFTQAKANGDLGITRADVADSGVLRTISYLAAERPKIAELIRQLAGGDDGFDFQISPSRQWIAYFPRRGGPTKFVLETGKNVEDYGWTADAFQVVSDLTGLGAGEGRSKLIVLESDVAAAVTFGLMEDVISETDVDDAGLLQSIAGQELANRKTTQEIPTLTVVSSGFDVPIGGILPGDEPTLRISDGFVDVKARFHVSAITVSVPEQGVEKVGVTFDRKVA
jgi:hypothetical protein